MLKNSREKTRDFIFKFKFCYLILLFKKKNIILFFQNVNVLFKQNFKDYFLKKIYLLIEKQTDDLSPIFENRNRIKLGINL